VEVCEETTAVKRRCLFLVCVLFAGGVGAPVAADGEDAFVNSVGMKMVRIGAGSFSIGSEEGDFDEKPVHNVTISRAFYMSECEVTNGQYEQFDPEHRHLDHRGFTHEAGEAVIFVSWEDANSFCEWLSVREGRIYRLPTEAEWEYACRAGTDSHYNTGDELPEANHKDQSEYWGPHPVDLGVGNLASNSWGLYDMHGNVEEWCRDWYGPYEGGDQIDPVGRADGDFRVCRGGSHSTDVVYLRSANRMGTLPEDKHWMTGFRVVAGEFPDTAPLARASAPLHQTNVNQEIPGDIEQGPDRNVPYFAEPQGYVNIPEGSNGPIFSQHNHQPAITVCPDGDVLAIWYSTIREPGRELAVVGNRLRYGSEQWEEASLFWDGPDRNDHGSSIWWDGKETIYHFNGLADAATWGGLALVMRTSGDNGATWSKARLISPRHGLRHQVIAGTFRTAEGYLVVKGDAVTGGNGGTALHISRDEGLSWVDPGEGRAAPVFDAGERGAWIAGIHAAVAQLRDGRLLAFGRGDNIYDMMPMSVSADMGERWMYCQSEFPRIGGGQRAILKRLEEGVLLFASFSTKYGRVTIEDAYGNTERVDGLYAAVSFDDGESWPVKKLVSTGGPGREVCGLNDKGCFEMDETHAEPGGYMAVTQARNGVIHLISSKMHYRFNLAWLGRTGNRAPVVDDFELYGSSERLLGVWSGAANMTVELDTVRYDGSYSMRCEYGGGAEQKSEAVFVLPQRQDWTVGGAKALSLWFRGYEPGTGGQMYVTVEDASSKSTTVGYDGTGDFMAGQWYQWNINLQDFVDAGVDVTNVSKLVIGFEGGSGTVYFDEVRLYRRRCVVKLNSAGDFNDDCVVDHKDVGILAGEWLDRSQWLNKEQPDSGRLLLWYKFDETEGETAADSSGKSHDGVVIRGGGPVWEGGGFSGGCLNFDNDTRVEVPSGALHDVGDAITICVWLNGREPVRGADNTVFEAGRDGHFLRADVPDAWDIIGWHAAGEAHERVTWYKPDPSNWRDGWNHFAFVKDAAAGYMRLYHNGLVVGEETGEFGPPSLAGDGPFRIGSRIDHADDYVGRMDDFKVYGYALSPGEIVGAATGGWAMYVSLNSRADLHKDDRIDFKDIAVLADKWLHSGMWP